MKRRAAPRRKAVKAKTAKRSLGSSVKRGGGKHAQGDPRR